MIANSPQHVATVRTEHLRLRKIVRQIGALCQQQLGDEQFYPQYLRLVVQALNASGGAIWLPDADGRWQCRWRHASKVFDRHGDADAYQRHLPLANQAAASERVLTFTGHDHSGIGTDQTVVAVAVRNAGQATAVVELILPLDVVNDGRQQIESFVQKMAEMASARPVAVDRGEEDVAVASPSPTSTLRPLQRLGVFVQAVHRSLDLETTGFAVANEMRLMLGCDRVSVAVAHNGACQLLAVSGQDTIDRRADTVRQLEALARAALPCEETVWRECDGAEIPKQHPQIEKSAQALAVDSPWTTLGVLPLRESPDDDTIGVIIVEQINGKVSRDDLARRVEIVIPHVTQALANARDHGRIFLLPLWQTLGRWKRAATTRWRRLLIWLTALLGVTLFLGLFPVRLQVHGRGVLQPSVQRDVFADVHGVVTEVYVEHGDHVQAGDALVKLHNSDLEMQIADVLGRRSAVQEHLAAIHRRRHEERLAREATDRLTGQMLQLQEQLNGLDHQHELLLEKQQQLVIRSPIAGQVLSWNIQRRLMLRPVVAGQVLLTIADEQGPWQLEVFLEESEVGHLTAAKNSSAGSLPVEYLAVSQPAAVHRGTLQQLDEHAQLYDDHGHAVRMLVGIDRSDVPDTPAGATVRARIDCGQRAIGYVWLHRLIGFAYTRVLFRMG